MNAYMYIMKSLSVSKYCDTSIVCLFFSIGCVILALVAI